MAVIMSGLGGRQRNYIMTKTIGIIPAGGKADRFKGIAKELLPVSPNDCALSRVIKSMRMGEADEIYIGSRRERVAEHWQIADQHKGVSVITHADGFGGMWDVIATVAAKGKADWYYFAMADTVYPADVFMREKKNDVSCGVFQTNKPERFGVVADGRITDKPQGLTGTHLAWGVWIFSGAAMDALAKACRETKDHTAALNALIAAFPVDAFVMPYYYDLASFEDYAEFLCQLT
jgi:dTDP-glucose pyrophosphorylase